MADRLESEGKVLAIFNVSIHEFRYSYMTKSVNILLHCVFHGEELLL